REACTRDRAVGKVGGRTWQGRADERLRMTMNSMDMKDKVVLVTAGSKGLGAEVVRQLADRGADVAFTYKQDTAAARSMVREAEQMGRRCLAIRADAADYGKAQKIVNEVARKLRGLDILVCNAGIARAAAIGKMKEAEWDEVMNVTLKGAFNYINAVAPRFSKQGSGKIVCVGSINGLRGRVGTVS